jgi:hypothetical protein
LAKATIGGGQCGFTTTVEAVAEGRRSVVLTIHSGCDAVRKLAEELKQVDPFREMTYRGEGPLTLELARKHLKHGACPVPAGIIKTVELASGMGLPVDVVIKLEK